MVRKSTDFPVPDPPTTPSTSPRRTSRSRFRKTTLLPKRASSPRTRIAGVSPMAPAGGSASRSDLCIAEDDREDGIGEDDEEDRLDDRARRQPADALGAARDAQALVAPGQGDDAGKGRRF